MKRFLCNGRLLPDDAAIAGPCNRGLRYGDAVFETIRCRNGKPLHADLHFARLWKGMAVLGFECPPTFTPAFLEAAICRLLEANGHRQMARVRLQVFRKDGGLFDPVNHQPSWFIESWELPEQHSALNSNGLVLGLYTGAWKSCDELANLKHSNFLPYLLAARHAQQLRWNEALILNQHGRLCDSTTANLFIIREGTVYTPALSEGCVAGTLRQQLLHGLPAAGIPVQECALTPDDLLSAEEVFLTNAIRPIRWVQSFGDQTYSNRQCTEIYQLLMPTIG